MPTYPDLTFSGVTKSFASTVQGTKVFDPVNGLWNLLWLALQHLEQGWYGVSGSSNTLATGSPKTFTLTYGRGFKVLQPIVAIAYVGATATAKGYGEVTAYADSTRVLTLEFDAVEGDPGPYTSWEIMLCFHQTTVAAPPVVLADGGTGATTAAGARANFHTGFDLKVLSVLSVPPGSPSDGDRHLVGNDGIGVFDGQAGKVAEWSASGAAWGFTAGSNDPQSSIFLVSTGLRYVYTGNSETAAPYAGAPWRAADGAANLPGEIYFLTTATDGTAKTLTYDDLRKYRYFVAGSAALTSNLTLTLPDGTISTDEGFGQEVTIINLDLTHDIIANASGGTIGGVASKTLDANERLVVVGVGQADWPVLLEQ